MKRALIPLCLTLAGCAHGPPPEPVVRTVTVQVPVPQPCPVKLPPEEALPSKGAALTGDVLDLAKLTAADRLELMAALAEWKAVARACATQ